MKTIDLGEATASLAEYVKDLGEEPVVITHRGVKIAVLVPLENADYESVELANNPKFLAILEKSRSSYYVEGGLSSEEMRRLFETSE